MLKDIILQINDNCSLKCPYCFAGNFVKKSSHHISEKDFNFFLNFCKNNEIELIKITGGEPFLNENIHKYIYELSFASINVFTNFTIKDSVKNIILRNKNIGFVVNLNNKKDYSSEQWETLIKNLDESAAKSYTIVLGYNVYNLNYDFDEIIRLSRYYKCKRMRVSAANPTIKEKNIYLHIENIKKVVKSFRKLYYELEKYGIRLDIDCPVAPCYCDYDDYKFLYNKNLIRNNCSPMIFVHYDLSIGNCYVTDGLFKQKNLKDVSLYSEAKLISNNIFNEVIKSAKKYIQCSECKNEYKSDELCGCIGMFYRLEKDNC